MIPAWRRKGVASRAAPTAPSAASDCRNYLGNPFRPDFSTPSTHLLYGWWVGATADGRKSRDMLNYGVDPLFGDADHHLTKLAEAGGLMAA